MTELHWSLVLLLAEGALRLGLALRVLLRGRQPSVTLAWLLVLTAFPVLGVVAYLLVGEIRLGGGRVRRHEEIVERMRAVAVRHHIESYVADVPEEGRRTMAVAQAVGGLPPRRGNEVELLGDSEEVIRRLVADIDAARQHAHLLFYIYLADGAGRQVAAALRRAASRGVACRLLLDGVGSSAMLRSPLCQELREAGVEVVEALPTNVLRAAFSRLDLRNHRKIAVIDGQVGWTGSQNIAEASFAPKRRYAPWVDATLRLRGPAVRDLQELFLTDWYQDSEESLEQLLEVDPVLVEDGVPVQIIPTGPGYDPAALQELVASSCHVAREEFIMTTPYFVPGEAEIATLCTTARRGVSVVLVVPARNDSLLVGAASRSHYQRLLDAGVEIHEYTKGLLHAKTFTVDRRIGLVGTANFDRRSFELNFEVNVLLHDSDAASRLRFLQRSYMADSLPVDGAAWRRRPWPLRLLDNAAGVLTPVL